MSVLYLGDNLTALKLLPDSSVNLVYADPPFGTNKDRRGKGSAYEDTWSGIAEYVAWLRPRIEQIHRVLSSDGSLYLHLDRRGVHHVRLLLDEVFGPRHFQNEIIWHYTGGGRTDRRFPHKHDNILVYNKSCSYKFKPDSVREPYAPTSGYAKSGIVSMAGKLYSPNPLGKLIDDVWFIPIVNPMSGERTGYPTQKPERLLERIVLASTDRGDLVLDPFCGSGTTPVVAEKLGREWIGMDSNPESVDVASTRLRAIGAEVKVSVAGEAGDAPPIIRPARIEEVEE